jgi:homoaconitase/3-isopropylmalate dehydratase large subunit
VLRDITKNKENESLLANMFDSIQDGLNILDKDLNIIKVNKVFIGSCTRKYFSLGE